MAPTTRSATDFDAIVQQDGEAACDQLTEELRSDIEQPRPPEREAAAAPT